MFAVRYTVERGLKPLSLKKDRSPYKQAALPLQKKEY
jgi:hypothetical protein